MSSRVHSAPPFLRRSRRPEGLARRSRRWLLVTLGIVLGYLVVFGESGLASMRSLRAENLQLVQQNERLRQNEAQLRARIEALQKPRSFALESVARDVYRLQRPDERVLHVVGGSESELP